MGSDITKKMLNTIREGVEKNRHYTANPIEDEEYVAKPTFLSEARQLMDEVVKKKINEEVDKSSDNEDDENKIEITKNTPQFGDVYTKQAEQIKKTLNEDIEIKLYYVKDIDDLIVNGKIKSLGLLFQFRYRDPSSVGVYIWAKELQVSDENSRLIGKIRDCFLNWKKSLVEDSDFLEKLKKSSEKK